MNFNIGDFVLVRLKDGSEIRGIVLKKYNDCKDNRPPAFYVRAIIHMTKLCNYHELKNWKRYGIEDKTGIFIETEDCISVKVVVPAKRRIDRIVSVVSSDINIAVCHYFIPVTNFGNVYLTLIKSGEEVYAGWDIKYKYCPEDPQVFESTLLSAMIKLQESRS